jgi:hypothetical protein
VVITQGMLQEAWDGLRGAVTIAYPQGLPEYDEVSAAVKLVPMLFAIQQPPFCCCCHLLLLPNYMKIMIIFSHALQVQAVLDDNFDPDSMTQECVPVDSAEMWWAGKKMTRDKLLSDFVGRNDKTKVSQLPLTSPAFFPRHQTPTASLCR